jgi:predicted  nucleic acid-binding Zn-ribbon protein
VSLAELEALLLVQERDTALDRLRHRRETLPERAELVTQTSSFGTNSARRAELQSRRDAIYAEEKRLDDEARTIGAHADEVDKKLYSGTVTSPRELQAMQADIEMLKRRRSELEDDELEVMEQREALDGELEKLAAEGSDLEAAVARLRDAIATQEQEIDAEIAMESDARAQAAAPIAPALLQDYERRRVQNRGAGAARLVGTTCQACHLTIPSTEAERIRRAGGEEVAYCDNCSAILVP